MIQCWSWKYWKSSQFDSVLILEILEIQSCWFSFDPGNTGNPSSLITWVSELILCCVWTYTLLCLTLYFVIILEIMSEQALFQKWLPRPNHYAHEICIKILCRTPVSTLKYLSPRPPNHRSVKGKANPSFAFATILNV